jgi:hypothetical protein
LKRLAAFRSQPARKPRYLFVVGCPRAGTTILGRLLNGHPQIALGIERYVIRADRPEFIDPSLFERERFFTLKKGDTWITDLDAVSPEYGLLRERWDTATYLGDKIPLLFHHVDQLVERFPGVKVVMSLRNVEDVAKSWRVRDQRNPGRFWGEKGRFLDQWNASLEAAAAHPDVISVVEYEAIFHRFADPKPIFDHLGLEVTDSIYQKLLKFLRTSEALQKREQRILEPEDAAIIADRARMDLYEQLLARSLVKSTEPVFGIGGGVG